MNYRVIGKNILRIVLVAGIIFWMTVIFGFSAAEGEMSQSTSDMITEIIVENIYADYDSMPIEKQKEIWENISFAVRKTGHFGEYGILAVLVSGLLLTFDRVVKNKKWLLFAVAFCAVYAITDEIHQGFVAGRSPKFMDVCIDTAGAACGTAFIVWINNIAVLLRQLEGPKLHRGKCS